MGRAEVTLAVLALASAALAEEKPVVCFGCNAVDVLRLDVELRDHPPTIQELTSSRAVVVTATARHDLAQAVLLMQYVRKGGRLLVQEDPYRLRDDAVGRALYRVRGGRDRERTALVLVIDRSASMTGKKFELAKRAARHAVGVLCPTATIGIVAFDSVPNETVRLTSVRNTALIDSKLKWLVPAGGTDIYRGLERGYAMLEGSEARRKHVVLMTDGQSNRTGIYNLVHQAASKHITTSAIAIGVGSDRALLEQIARIGNGRYYFTDNPEALPMIVADEARSEPCTSVSRRPGTRVLRGDPHAWYRRVGRGAVTLWLGDPAAEPEAWRKVLERFVAPL